MIHLVSDPGLELFHFPVELLQAPPTNTARRPRLIGRRLSQSLPVISQRAQLSPHQLCRGVQLADQLLSRLQNTERQRGFTAAVDVVEVDVGTATHQNATVRNITSTSKTVLIRSTHTLEYECL